MAFSRSIGFWGGVAKKFISYPPLRPVAGGIIIALAVWLLGTTKYIGLGVPTIVASFSEQQMWYDFLLKLIFAGATNTPIACTFMGIELFGIEPGIYLGIACVVAYLFSGHTGIYTSQVVGTPKHLLYLRDKGKTLK